MFSLRTDPADTAINSGPNCMPDKRRLKRRNLIYYLSVFERNTGRRIGQAVNITTEGIMLTSDSSIETQRLFQLKMLLPEEIKGNDEISFDARSLWCQRGINPDFYDIGFEFLCISQENAAIIEKLIFGFSFHD
jgi:hypothetical protein